MTREQQLDFLIEKLSSEIANPPAVNDKWHLFRTLVNIRESLPVDDLFLQVQNELLQSEIENKGITDIADLRPVRDNLYLWRGDITTLKVDAIVNAANSGMLGCFIPCHACIDNAIHTFAGVQLRLECADLMNMQGQPEQTGYAKVTAAYNLPSKYILHTVGPIIRANVSNKDRQLLANCYRSCLEQAEQNGIQSIAFCCISTGEYHFPNKEAAQIAVNTVCDFLKARALGIKVIFNVFTDQDEQIYKRIFG